MNRQILFLAGGIALAAAFARILRLPAVRDASRRQAVALLVAALIYVAFAAAGGSAGGVAVEAAGAVAFGGVALLGYRRHSPALLALGWAIHPLWDVALHSSGGGLHYTPLGYPPLCIGFDLALAALIALGRAGAPAVASPPRRRVGAAHPHDTENQDMAFALRHRDDPIPFTPAPLPGLEIRIEEDPARMAALQGRTREEMERRFAAGHRAYLALLDGEPAAWGWVATRAAEIGEIGATFPIPAGERYLWNFVTRKEHRGRGIYPRLLQGILRAESREAERFWIGYAPENHASGAGIRKAGFAVLAEVAFDDAGRPAVKAIAPGGDAAVARLLGLPVADDVTACWRCVRAGKHPAMACAEGECCCDYQRLEVECAA